MDILAPFFSPLLSLATRWYRQEEIDRWISGVFSEVFGNGNGHPRRSNEGRGREIPRRTFSHGRPASLFTNKKGLSSPSPFLLSFGRLPLPLRVPLGSRLSLCLSAFRSSRTPPPGCLFLSFSRSSPHALASPSSEKRPRSLTMSFLPTIAHYRRDR